MARGICLVAVAVVILADAPVATAQVTSRLPQGPRTAGAGHIRQAPSTDDPSPAPQSVSKLRFQQRRDMRLVPSPLHVGGRGRSFGFVTLWPGSGIRPSLVAAAPTTLLLPSDSGLLGGLQLDVQPWRAQVYVDGTYAGVAEDFGGYYHHLELVPGLHVIMIIAPDYEPLILEVVVAPGHTTTYRGTLSRASGR